MGSFWCSRRPQPIAGGDDGEPNKAEFTPTSSEGIQKGIFRKFLVEYVIVSKSHELVTS